LPTILIIDEKHNTSLRFYDTGRNVLKYTGALLLLLLLTACGRSPAEVAQVNETAAAGRAATLAALPTAPPAELVEGQEAPIGDAARGAVLFQTMQTTSSGAWMCSSCHSIESTRLVGPGLLGVGARDYVEGDHAEYIRHSITNPNDFIVPADPAYPENLMPQNYAELYSEDDLNDLVAYLLTLN
jgi:mono/diheme cytochrome c family protein